MDGIRGRQLAPAGASPKGHRQPPWRSSATPSWGSRKALR